jgi:hypothetical protein
MSNETTSSPDAAIAITPDVLEPDAAVPDAPDAAIDAPIDAAAIDAPPRTRIDAPLARVPIDSPIAPATPDVLPTPPPDVAPAVVEKGKITVVNDTWCIVTIDKKEMGRISQTQTFDVDAGEHQVSCVQEGLNEWKQTVVVAGGKTVTAKGVMLVPVQIRFDLDVTIRGKTYAKGTTAELKPERVNIGYGGKNEWFTIPRFACRLHLDGGRLVCDP